MEIISFDSFSLKDAITEAKVISKSGSFGTVFLHGNSLLKIDRNLFSLIDVNCRELANHVFRDVYRYDDNPFVSKKQIEHLLSLQSKITLTDFDKGIVLVNERICGTILTPHLDYQDLTNYQPKSLLQLLKILENILKALRELEINGISHEDLVLSESHKAPTFNVLYKDDDIKLCDLSGEFIHYGDSFNPSVMYSQYLQLLFILIKRVKDEYPEIYDMFKDIDYSDCNSYDDSARILEKIDEISK